MITDYATLQTAIGNWMNRADLAPRVPEFIQLAEARLKRKLEDELQETVATITFVDGIADLPSDFDGLIDIDGDFSEDPITYDIVGDEIQTDPAINGDATINYSKTLPSLSDSNPTNWMLDRAPDIYLYASLIQAEFYGWNDERLPLIKAALDEALEELRLDNNRRRWGTATVYPKLGRS